MIEIEKHWEDLETFEVDVLDKFGEPFIHKGKQWRMTLRPPESEKVKEAVRKNADEASRWRSRQPAANKNADLPEEMAAKHFHKICAASHVAWTDPPTKDGASPDFDSPDFLSFLQSETWYVLQWGKAWADVKNSTRPVEPKASSSSGRKNSSS